MRLALPLVVAASLPLGLLVLGREGRGTGCPPPPTGPAHSRTLAVNPASPNEAWVVNQENDSVSIVDAATGQVIDANPDPNSWSIQVGVLPRRIAFTPNGAKAYVTNSRGNVPRDRTILEFTGAEILGTVSVIDPAQRKVVKTILTGLGVEPYGLAVAPNGKWAVVANLRSATLSFLDTSTDSVALTHAYPRNLNFMTPVEIAEADTNGDGIADCDQPAGVAISADSRRVYVSHFKSPFVSVLSTSLGPNGELLGATFVKAISLDKYHPFDAAGNPLYVNVLKSQGDPRWLEDLAISPDGARLWVPHLLLNEHHNVTNPALNPAFRNRVYPAISIVDLATETFEWSDPIQTDGSFRLEYELSQTQLPGLPAVHVPFGTGVAGAGSFTPVLRGIGDPVLGGTVSYRVEKGLGGAPGFLVMGFAEQAVPMFGGTLYVEPAILFGGAGLAGTPGAAGAGSRTWTVSVPNDPLLAGASLYAQGLVFDLGAPLGIAWGNALRTILGNPEDAVPDGRFGFRAAHPSRVEFSGDGRRAYLLDRAGEEILVFDATVWPPRFLSAWPRRDVGSNHNPFDPTRMIGDTPSGFVVLDDPGTADADACVYVMNETSRDVSLLRANHDAATLALVFPNLIPVVQTDAFTAAERRGREAFADASRPATSKNFTNSCEGCHFEGNDDSTLRWGSAGPRSKNPWWGGAWAAGYLTWKAVRINLGALLGPAMIGENGGTGAVTPEESQGATAWHDTIPVPLNPNLVNGTLSPLARLGRDLYFGENATGLNPGLRRSGCDTCHPREDQNQPPPYPLLPYTIDRVFIADPTLPPTQQDPCFVLGENLVGTSVSNVNSGVNIDFDGDGLPDPDRNGDGILDLESYAPLNTDKATTFTLAGCYNVPGDPTSGLRSYTRDMRKFTVPTKLGVFATSPYMHDHVAKNLRSVIDPASQAWPTLGKLRNTQHDIRGLNVQFSLNSGDAPFGPQTQADIEAILAFIESL